MEEKNIITKEGLLEVQKEFEDRKTTIRKKIADEIELAREQGDLSENAAYKSAIEENQFNEKKILELDEFLQHVEVVAESTSKTKVGIGSKVKVINITLDQEQNFEIVSPTEADPQAGKISNMSPLGIALGNRKISEEFKFTTPSGEQLYKILEIN
jgi:transcription elongation factor GreA